MFVIVEIAGLQYKVEKDQKLYVNRLAAAEGETVRFDRVLLSNNGTVEIGAPVINGLTVEAKVLEHLKGDKVIVFKKKRRKGYKVKNGYRAALTKIEILTIGAGKGSSKKATEESAEKKTAKAKVENTEATPKTAKTADTPKATVAPKTTAKKATTAGDDLTKVEGIGPKVKGLFNDAGISTFAELASKTADELKDILVPHGGRYAGMNTETWPKQAQLAAENKWDELKKWQDELNGGKA